MGFTTRRWATFRSVGANIQRTGSSPNFSYSVAADWANRPVNYVSFWDAARFANWLHNGQPTGAQGPGTTEDGAYHDVGNQTLFGRNAGAKFFIPTEDEWYKAAYHDKTAGLAASYFDYPTGTNAVPETISTKRPIRATTRISTVGSYAIGSPYYRTVVGEFELSDSPYGTFDQGGNVWEWNETAVFSSSRGLRGGSFIDFSRTTCSRPTASYDDPTTESDSYGVPRGKYCRPGAVNNPSRCRRVRRSARPPPQIGPPLSRLTSADGSGRLLIRPVLVAIRQLAILRACSNGTDGQQANGARTYVGNCTPT